MTPEKYRDELVMIAQAAQLIHLIDVPAMLQAIDRADSFGPILDPTLWMRNHKKMDEDKEMLEAALPLWRLGERLSGIAPTGRGGEG